MVNGSGSITAEPRFLVRELHDGYRKQLARLSVQEERLVDLAADVGLPTTRIRQRLQKIAIDREQAKAGLSETSEKLEVGAEAICSFIDLLDHPEQLYALADDNARREFNSAFYERLYVDEDGVVDDLKTNLVSDLHVAAHGHVVPLTPALAGYNEAPGDSEGDLNFANFLRVELARAGSSKSVLVPPAGFEPALGRV